MSDRSQDGPVNPLEKCGLFSDHWQPRVVAKLNDYHFKVARVQGDFVWHAHQETDEAFFVLEGELRIDMPGRSVVVSAGELFVVPRGVRHKPFAEKEVKLMLIEPGGVVNTGEEGGDLTAEVDVWI